MSEPGTTKGLRVLLADEALSMRHFLAMCLAELRHLEIHQAADGASAFEKLSEHSYAVVLLDLALPGKPALDLIRFVHDRCPQAPTPVIITSALHDRATEDKVRQLGAHFMPRPVQAAALRIKIRELLGLPTLEAVASPNLGPARREKIEIRARFAGERTIETITETVDAVGAFFVSDDVAAVGSRGQVTLHLPELSQPLVVDSRVVHIRPNDVGRALKKGFAVRFEPATAELSTRLARAFLPGSAGRTPTQKRLTQLLIDLRRIPIFHDLTEDELAGLQAIVEWVELDADELVLEEGAPSNAFFVIGYGGVTILKGEGEDEQVLAVLGSGDFFGEMGVILDSPRSATGVTVEPSGLYRIGRKELLGFLRGAPAVAAKIRTTMVNRYAENVSSIFATAE